MKKVILSLLSLVILANMSIASDWQLINQRANHKFFIDKDSIEKINSFWNGKKIYYWQKSIDEYGNYDVTQLGVSCYEKKVWMVAKYYYLNTDEAIGQENINIIQKYLIAPDTVAMTIYNKYCKI